MSYFDKPNPSSRDCLGCGSEVNPSMTWRWDKTPWIGDRVTHFSCIEAIEDAARTLAHNLAIAGALCRAFRLGREWQAEYLTAQWNGGGWTYPFEPGCGRSAP